VLELGLGAGVASLCLAARVPDLALTGVERDAVPAALARANAAANGIALTVVEADLRRLPPPVSATVFDHVMANPPFFAAEGRSRSPEPLREAARGEDAALADWLLVGMRRLRPGGWLTVIEAAARLPEMLAALPSGGVVVRPLAARQGRAAERVIVQARKGGRAAFRLEAALILHRGERHLADGDDHADWASAVLRGGAPLPPPG
jgi:tRNA1(Val) A37 N6-methylase TrmN6